VTSTVAERDVLQVSGPDAESFLQGQLSQDITSLAPTQSAWSFVLQPQGKVDALVRVTRINGDGWLLDVDAGYGEAVAARLNRFKLRVKADIEPVAWAAVGDRLGPAFPVPAGADEERTRIELGWPRMGAELTEKTIPAETGIVDRTVSFTKGCFTGQELVARIDSRGGNVPRHLRGVRLAAAGAPAGAELVDDGGKVVGTITSVVEDVAFAYVARDVEPPAEVIVRWDGGESTARVEVLPLAS
jgi:tRNA-modifying protein YgfZ